MEKPDPYGDWALFRANEGKPDEELVSAARAAWPHALAQAEREFSAARLGSDGAAFAVQVWEQLLRSVSKTRQRNRDRRNPISNLEGYLIGTFRHRFTRVLVREQKRASMIEIAFESVIVQPGFSKTRLDERIGALLAAADGFLYDSGPFARLRVIGSA